ncbi:MAG: peptidoglycan-binding domain-containing protein [Fidelibacterota bacterium]
MSSILIYLLILVSLFAGLTGQANNIEETNIPAHVAGIPNLPDDALQSILWHEQYLPEERMLFKILLKELGYSMNAEDPLWQPADVQMVKKFQRDHKIHVDGKIGPETMNMMLRALSLYYEQIADIPYVIDLDLLPPGVIVQNRERVRVGEIVKYFNRDLARFRYARVLSIHKNRVEILDWTRKETFIVDIDDLNK